MTNRNSATYGSGIFGLDPGARDTYEATQRLGDWIRERFAAPDYRPPVVPSVAIELQALSRDPEVDVKRVVALLEKDGLLAAQVLRLASSPVYATATPPRSLHEAVVRLGMRTLSDVVWEAVLRLRVFRVRKYAPFMESVRNHSCATAHVARALAAYTSLPAEYAFLCGLLHDIGTAAALIVVSEELPEAKLYDEVLGGTLAVLHEELSRLVTSVWKLPQELQLASGYHHTIKIGGYAHPLAALVYLADTVSAELGAAVHIGPSPVDAVDERQVKVAREALGIDDRKWQLALGDARKRLGENRRDAEAPR